jgi:DNA polymerase (family X)
MGALSNHEIATRLREAAALLHHQGANPFRVGAYRRAADTLAGLGEDVCAIVARGGLAGVEALPGIGHSLARAIDEMCRTGRWIQLARLRGALEPDQVFRSIPGVGPELAQRIHETLEVETLEALEIAAHDGRLEKVPGIGARRAAMIRGALGNMLRSGRPRRPDIEIPAPDIALLLDVDREYREKAAAGNLRRIAPRRFNPQGTAWLPILHAQRGDWHFTALYSNTARAHDLGRTTDWVVIYYHTDSEPEGQCTVVTETRGPLAGRRVVRGREAACRDFYAAGAGAGGS